MMTSSSHLLSLRPCGNAIVRSSPRMLQGGGNILREQKVAWRLVNPLGDVREYRIDRIEQVGKPGIALTVPICEGGANKYPSRPGPERN